MTEEQRRNLQVMLCSPDKQDVLLAKSLLHTLSQTEPMEEVFHCIDEAYMSVKERMDPTNYKEFDSAKKRFDRVATIRQEMLLWYREKRINNTVNRDDNT